MLREHAAHLELLDQLEKKLHGQIEDGSEALSKLVREERATREEQLAAIHAKLEEHVQLHQGFHDRLDKHAVVQVSLHSRLGEHSATLQGNLTHERAARDAHHDSLAERLD